MGATRQICLKFTNDEGLTKLFLPGDVILVVTDTEELLGKLNYISLSEITLDCSIEFTSNITKIALPLIREVLSYEEYLEMSPIPMV